MGIGPGAHGRLTLQGHRFATVAPKAPGAWLAQVRAGKAGEDPRDTLSSQDWAEELILMGLRTQDGIDLSRIERLTGRRVTEKALQSLLELAMIEQTGSQITATAQGRLVLNAVIRALADGI